MQHNEQVDVAMLLRSMARAEGLPACRLPVLIADVPQALPEITGDEVRLRQVVRNLLRNAAKYTAEHGAITLRAPSEVLP